MVKKYIPTEDKSVAEAIHYKKESTGFNALLAAVNAITINPTREQGKFVFVFRSEQEAKEFSDKMLTDHIFDAPSKPRIKSR